MFSPFGLRRKKLNFMQLIEMTRILQQIHIGKWLLKEDSRLPQCSVSNATNYGLDDRRSNTFGSWICLFTPCRSRLWGPHSFVSSENLIFRLSSLWQCPHADYLLKKFQSTRGDVYVINALSQSHAVAPTLTVVNVVHFPPTF
jgi:hypothetical protein